MLDFNLKTRRMGLESVIFFALKTLGWGLLIYIFYIIYNFIYLPWRIRRKYKNWPNVAMTEKFYPMLGDITIIVQNEKENKHKMRHYVELALKDKDYDLNITQMGDMTQIDVLSSKALTEFEKLVPEKIDRHHNGDGFPIGNILPRSLVVTESTQEWLERRKEEIKTLGINRISQYIPLMIATTDEWAKTVNRNQRIDISLEVSRIVFRVIAKILFGDDVDTMPPIPYISYETGETKSMIFEEFYFQYTRDEFDGYLSPKGKFLPFLAKYGLVEPYKSNLKNHESFFDAIRKFVAQTKDTESVYKRLEAIGKFSQEVLVADTVMLLFAGFDTISHLITSCLFQLKKYPETLSKLMESSNKWGIVNVDKSKGSSLKDIYENCDYLNYVIKETLRLDGPAVYSVLYYAKDEVEICGVPISKGTTVKAFVVTPHEIYEILVILFWDYFYCPIHKLIKLVF